MANYHNYSVIEVTDKEDIGMGFGENENGEERICISLPGKKINSHLDPMWNEVNWISMSMECMKQLHKNLDDYLKYETNKPVTRQILITICNECPFFVCCDHGRHCCSHSDTVKGLHTCSYFNEGQPLVHLEYEDHSKVKIPKWCKLKDRV